VKDPRDNQISSGDSASTCEAVEDRVHELLDRRQPLLSDEVVRDHTSQCDQCAQLIVDLGALNDSVSQIPLAMLHRLSGIHEAELVEEFQQPSKPAHPVLFVASIACLLFVALTSGVWFSGNSDNVAVVDRLAQEEAVSIAIVESGSVENGVESSEFESQPEMAEVLIPSTMQHFGLVTTHKMSSPTEVIGAVNFEDFSGNVEPYQEYIGMTADLPGMRPVSNSVTATIQFIKTFSSQQQRNRYSAL